MALNINSVFKDIREQLKRILFQLTQETNSKDNCVTINKLSYKKSNSIWIPMTDINQVIDMMGHFKQSFKDNKNTPRIKLAGRIRVLNHSFVSTCAVIRKLNDEENILLFFHLTIFVMHFATSLIGLYIFIQSIEFSNSKLFMLIVDLIWFIWHIVKPMLLIEPCQQTQDELAEIRLLVGQIICHVNSESDPLLGVMDAFFQQIILNETSYTVIGICSLTRHIMSKIVGGATTMLLIFMGT
ncbi:uncharacterized protein LOC126775354 isoform X3 [Nymphalis io]|nr:uncharacterized protein LOC126775354 isoform X2 [Nymphalis io]XP_050353183.1 uncharacterized protein LOC126775354 isoform X3 [Nymphalis io]